MAWILLVLLFGILKGLREIAKKKAMAKNTVMEVLVSYTFISFALALPQAPNAGGLESRFYLLIALKAFAVFLAWICSFNSIKHLPVSLYGILDLSRVLFATSFGVFALGETLGPMQILGLAIVCAGLLLLKFRIPFGKKEEESPRTLENKSIPPLYVVLALVSCFLNAVSGFLDKVLMKDITSSQLQFWYMLFMVIYYALYVLAKRERISLSVIKNKWIWILAVTFVIGDKALFIANGIPESRITVMTLVKQSGCLVTIVGGYLVFKEKDTAYKILCAAVVIAGIVIGMI